MFTKEQAKSWWKQNWKYVVAVVGGCAVGCYATNRCVNRRFAMKEFQLNQTINEANSLLNDLSKRIDKTTTKVIEAEAKELFENSFTKEELTDILKETTTEHITENMKGIIKVIATDGSNFDKAIRKSVESYIDDNSMYIKKKIVESIRDNFDETFASDVKSAIEKAIEEAV